MTYELVYPLRARGASSGCNVIAKRHAAAEPEGAGNLIRLCSGRGLVLVDEPSEHVSAPNMVEGDVGL
jgi:hypothetical protein